MSYPSHPRFLLSIMTCDGREAVLAETLDNLKQTDWGDEPLVWRDTTRDPDPKRSQTQTALHLLNEYRKFDVDYFIFCEDDVDFNRHLRFNLGCWLPVRFRTLLVGTLYDGERTPARVANYDLLPCMGIGGSQAIVISRLWLPELLCWWREYSDEMQDLRIFRSVRNVFPHIFTHRPNLVQHRQVASTWGGGSHCSQTFDPDWRA